MLRKEDRHTSDDGIRRGDSGDDVFDNSLRQRPGNPLDIELLSATRRLVEHPINMLGIVCIHPLV